MCAWLTGWSKRKTVTITGQAGAGTDYQVDFSIASAAGGDFNLESHCTSFPNDIEVTDNDQTTLLDYYVEDLTVDPIKMWVEVADNLGSNVDICVYYGKSGASSQSDGDATFQFFDDFSSDSLTIDSSGDPIIAYESIPEIQDESFELVLKMETKLGHGGWSYSKVGYYLKDISTNDRFKGAYYVRSGNYAYISWVENDVNQFYEMSNIKYADDYQFYTILLRHIKETEFRQITLNDDKSEKLNISHAETSAFYPDQLALMARKGSQGSINYDAVADCYKLRGHKDEIVEEWIHRAFIRKYQASEPAYASAGAEESAPSGLSIPIAYDYYRKMWGSS